MPAAGIPAATPAAIGAARVGEQTHSHTRRLATVANGGGRGLFGRVTVHAHALGAHVEEGGVAQSSLASAKGRA